MRIEDAVAQKLVAVLGHSRVYPDGIPQDQVASPCAAYRHESSSPQFYLNGGRDATEIDTFGIEIWGPDRDALGDTRDALLAAFTGRPAAGVWGGSGGVTVTGACATDASGDAIPPAHGTDDVGRSVRLTLRVIWERV